MNLLPACRQAGEDANSYSYIGNSLVINKYFL